MTTKNESNPLKEFVGLIKDASSNEGTTISLKGKVSSRKYNSILRQAIFEAISPSTTEVDLRSNFLNEVGNLGEDLRTIPETVEVVDLCDNSFPESVEVIKMLFEASLDRTLILDQPIAEKLNRLIEKKNKLFQQLMKHKMNPLKGSHPCFFSIARRKDAQPSLASADETPKNPFHKAKFGK